MYRKLNILVWLLMIIGISLLMFHSGWKNRWIFQFYLTCIEGYLIGVSAFLVLKYSFIFGPEREVESIKLLKESEYRPALIWQGILLGLIALVFIQVYTSLRSINTILLILVLLFYLIQIALNAKPSIHISSKSFAFDDYFVEQWDWQDLERIELEGNKLRLIHEKSEFELDFDLIDAVDDVHLSEEVNRAVLDGEFSRIHSSKGLTERLLAYARHYNVNTIRNSN